MWRAALDASGLVSFGEANLLGLESLLAIDCCPGDCRVTTSEKFLINAFVATAAITGCKFGHDYEAVMLLTVLILCRLVAIEAIDALLRMQAQFVFVDYRKLLPDVTLSALATRPHKRFIRLFGFNSGARPVNQECGDDQSKRDDNCNEN